MAESLKGIPINTLPEAEELDPSDQIIAYRADDGKAYRTKASIVAQMHVFCTQEEYDALPDTKYTDGVVYFIAEGGVIRNGIEYADFTGEIPDIPNIVTGYYVYDGDALSSIADNETYAIVGLWAHNTLLGDAMSINANIEATNDARTATTSFHMIGSKYNDTRGRYIIMSRTSDTIISVRITDSGASYVSVTVGSASTI